MSLGIISSRLQGEYNLGVFAASGILTYTQPTLPTYLERSIYPGNDVADPFISQKKKAFDPNDSIFLKRCRISCNLPGVIYALEPTSAQSVSFGWCNTVKTVGGVIDSYQRIMVNLDNQSFGEWVDVNMLLPRNDLAIGGVPLEPGKFYGVGSFLPSCNFWYQGVPAAWVSRAAIIRVEAEIAYSKELSLDWKGV